MQPLMLASNDEFLLVAVVGGLVVALVGMLTGFLRSVLKTRAREQTKREIAAYIAEGTMSPEDGERIIRADLKRDDKA